MRVALLAHRAAIHLRAGAIGGVLRAKQSNRLFTRCIDRPTLRTKCSDEGGGARLTTTWRLRGPAGGSRTFLRASAAPNLLSRTGSICGAGAVAALPALSRSSRRIRRPSTRCDDVNVERDTAVTAPGTARLRYVTCASWLSYTVDDERAIHDCRIGDIHALHVAPAVAVRGHIDFTGPSGNHATPPAPGEPTQPTNAGA